MATSVESVLTDAMDGNWFWEFFISLKIGWFARQMLGAGGIENPVLVGRCCGFAGANGTSTVFIFRG
jgi:hypothetical protein